MRRAALGFRMHSGWGVLVAISGDINSVEVVGRKRIVITDPSIPRGNQPYHYGVTLGLAKAEKYLANLTSVCEGLAVTAIEELVRELERQDCRIVGAAILWASGRTLPSLAQILASHPMIHTAEGEFFRNAIRAACARLNIAVTATNERELEEQAKASFLKAKGRVQDSIARVGNSIGPPWTKDHKNAALAAAIVLSRAETLPSTRIA